MLAAVGTVFVLLCSQTLCTARPQATVLHSLSQSFTAARPGIPDAATSATASDHDQGRQLLATAPVRSSVGQNVSFTFYSTFPESFVYFANTTLSGYDLLPVQGNCSIDPTLSSGVADCALEHQLCCLDASSVQVTCSRILRCAT